MISNFGIDIDGTGVGIIADDNVRITLAIVQKLRSTKRGSSFRTSKIHVTQAFMIQFVSDIRDYCILKSSKHKKVIPVVHDNQISIVSKEIVCAITDIFLCETFIADHVFETGWGVVDLLEAELIIFSRQRLRFCLFSLYLCALELQTIEK